MSGTTLRTVPAFATTHTFTHTVYDYVEKEDLDKAGYQNQKRIGVKKRK